jgi:hypothetical protein
MTTALDLIKGALRPLNVLTGNTTLTDQESQDALEALQWMLESWATEGLTLYHATRETFTLTASLNPHTWGIGGTFNSARPARLLQATVRVATVDYPLTLLGVDDYEAIRLKTLTTAWPIYGYYEPDYPLGKLYLWPIPTGNTINTVSEKPLTGFDTLYSVISLPPGYADAIRYNLALRLAPEYQIEAGADLKRLAEKSLRNLKRINQRTPTIAMDPMLRTAGEGRRWIVYAGP